MLDVLLAPSLSLYSCTVRYLKSQDYIVVETWAVSSSKLPNAQLKYLIIEIAQFQYSYCCALNSRSYK